MADSTFYIEIDIENNYISRKVIRQRDSDLAIKIYELQSEPFTTRADKLQLFAEIPGYAPLAFQCDAVDHSFETEVIAAALQWLAESQAFPHMTISLIDPRPAVN
jgi:hypothetical protein